MIPNAEGNKVPTTFFRIISIMICGVALCVSALIGIGVFMADGMSCGAPGSGKFCPDAVMLALVGWGVVSFFGPIFYLKWGLEPRRTQRERLAALLLIIISPIIGFAVNLLILFLGISLANLFL